MPCVDMIATGQKIKDIRVAQGKTVKDIQDVCGVSAAAVCKWQKGIVLPSVDNLVILASVFGVEIGQLIVTKMI